MTKLKIESLLEKTNQRHVVVLARAALILHWRLEMVCDLIDKTGIIHDDSNDGESNLVAMAWAVRRDFGINDDSKSGHGHLS